VAVTPPDPAPCWDGPWERADGVAELWLFAALLRTVDTLPRMHPWRLGDTKGSGRIVRWSAAPGDADRPRPAYAALTELARDPHLPLSVGPDPDADPGTVDATGLLFDLAVSVTSDVVSGVGRAVSDRLTTAVSGTAHPPAPQWAGVVARLPGTWLPPMAVLPRADRDLDDPGSAWTTESDTFNRRHTVHSPDERFAADVLAPHVMALVLDRVPDSAAVTLAGDAIHVWWEHRPPLRDLPALVHRMVDAVRDLADAIPSFVLADHPDRSGEVQAELAGKADAARRYRQQRHPGHSPDPVMQRIYDQARAGWAAPDVSSAG
jgi:hypothetical protein